jgi:hypothetical protein
LSNVLETPGKARRMRVENMAGSSGRNLEGRFGRL